MGNIAHQADLMKRIRQRLKCLYGEQAETCFAKITLLIQQFENRLAAETKTLTPPTQRSSWDQRDVVLITYGDQVQRRDQNEPPLATLEKFLVSQRLDDVISTVHILPFCPYSSDDGFSVIDYRTVDPVLGTWHDVRQLGNTFKLMFDLVLNHASSKSRWFEEFLANQAPYDGYFIEQDRTSDLSAVTRPRSSPLLTAFQTNEGTKHLWTTFSDDQVDLNFANPDLLVEMIDVFLYYLQQGATIVRLDAIAYLWKRIGTNCIHLPETHEVVKLFRDIIDAAAPHVLLLTETNVPHAENISYFGDGDEAHLVYQFSLPPLLLDAMLSHDASALVTWLTKLKPTAAGMGFFNFTASHDGIGVRPLEGLVSQRRINQLADAVEARGGLVSTRRKPDGTYTPYELNISYFSALGDPDAKDPKLHIQRFLTTQGLMLSLRGIPAIYFHSLFATPNDREAADQTNQPRRINRHKFQRVELEELLSDQESIPAKVFARYWQLLSIRRQQPAFHPDATQAVWPLQNPSLIALVRVRLDQNQRVLVLANVSDQAQTIDVTGFTNSETCTDLLTGLPCESARAFRIEPYGLNWLARYS